MFRNQFADAQEALGFLVSQTSYIEPIVYRTRYPSIQYENLIPVDGSAPEWIKSVTYFSVDQVGKADWFHHQSKDIPLADVQRNKFEVGVEMAAIGYRYTLEELGVAAMIPGMSLGTERANAARRAAEEMIDTVFMSGDTRKGLTGLINSDSQVTVVTAADGAGSAGTDWATKTVQEIMKDVNDALASVYTGSAEVEMADTILLPTSAMILLGTTIIPNTTISVGEFLARNNTYTFVTGQSLTIRGVRALETAGENGSGRMIAYRRDPEVLKAHMPMSHRFLPVWQTGPLVFDIPGIFRIGGVEIRLPAAVRYIDGIVLPPDES